MAEAIIVPGKIDIYIAQPNAYATAIKLGVSMDDIEIPMEVIKSPVYGDANGGRAGDPIEEQYLGNRARCSMQLSVWDKATMAYLLTHGGITATAGTIAAAAVGALMRTDHSYRVILVPIRDNSRGINFPCALVESINVLAGGTKHEALKIDWSFHRAPVGHLGGKDNVLYDRDLSLTGS